MSRAITKTKRTINQDVFCYEWVKDRNGARAAIVAGYSKKTAASQASRLLKNVNIQKKIIEILEKVFYTDQIEINQIVKHLINMAAFDSADVYDKEGNLKNIHDIPESIRRLIQGIKVTETIATADITERTKEFKFPDRLKATELLGRYLKMFVDQVEHKGEVKVVFRLATDKNGGNNKLLEEEK